MPVTTTHYYLKALKVRRLIRQDYDAAFEGVDLLLGPVTPTPAFPMGRKDRRPAGDVPGRYLYRHGQPCRRAGDFHSVRTCRPPACRSGLQLQAPAFQPSNGCFKLPPSPTSGKPISTSAEPFRRTLRRRHDRSLRNDYRPGSSRAVGLADQAVLPLQDRVRRAAQHANLPGLLGAAGYAARDEPRGVSAWRCAPPRRVNCDDSAADQMGSQATTTIPICPRATKSANTTCRCRMDGFLEIERRQGRL